MEIEIPIAFAASEGVRKFLSSFSISSMSSLFIAHAFCFRAVRLIKKAEAATAVQIAKIIAMSFTACLRFLILSLLSISRMRISSKQEPPSFLKYTIVILRFFRFAVHKNFEIITACKIFVNAFFIIGHILSAQNLVNRFGYLFVPVVQKLILPSVLFSRR